MYLMFIMRYLDVCAYTYNIYTCTSICIHIFAYDICLLTDIYMYMYLHICKHICVITMYMYIYMYIFAYDIYYMQIYQWICIDINKHVL